MYLSIPASFPDSALLFRAIGAARVLMRYGKMYILPCTDMNSKGLCVTGVGGRILSDTLISVSEISLSYHDAYGS